MVEGEYMKKSIFFLAGIICLCGTLFGCSNNHNREEPNDDLPIQNSISSTEESFVIDNTVNNFMSCHRFNLIRCHKSAHFSVMLSIAYTIVLSYLFASSQDSVSQAAA